MSSALCPNCHAPDMVTGPVACYRCGLNLVPGCRKCQRPVTLDHTVSGICPNCEDILEFTFIPRATYTTA